MTVRCATAVAATVLMLVTTSCGGDKSEPAASAPNATAPPKAEVADGSAPRAPITAAAMSPVGIYPVGPTDAAPTSILIQLAAPIIEQSRVGQGSNSKVKITPEIPGTLVNSGVSELRFTPHRPFDADTSYRFELVSVAVGNVAEGLTEPPAGQPWTHTFKTPPFKVLGWSPMRTELAGAPATKQITMDLAFSGTVALHSVIAATTFAIDGKPVAGVVAVPHGAVTNHAYVVLRDPRLAVGTKLTATTKPSLRSLISAAAPPTTLEHVVTADKPVSLRTAVAGEGGNGFYVDVVCDDAAAAAGSRGFYAGEAHYGLSQRCQLTDDAIGQIQFDPPVKNAYITSGSAGFRVFGKFQRGAYTVKINRGARSLDGGVVTAPFGRSFVVPARKPQLTFAAGGRYLPRSAWTNLGIKHTNIDQVSLVVRQIPAENLVFWLGEDSDAATGRTSDVILRKTIALRGAADAPTTSWLDVASLLPATTKGVLELKLAGGGTEATSRLLLTNLSLVAKKTAASVIGGKVAEQTVQVWALDIHTAEPIGDVDVTLIRPSGKAVARCTTAGSAGCTLKTSPDSDPDVAQPFALIARKGDDLTYLRYADLQAEVAESSTSGEPYTTAMAYRAAVWAERGVFRPGDTAHVVAIVRDALDRAPSQPVPVDVSIWDPRSKLVKKLALKTNAAGMLAFDYGFSEFADTGFWQVGLAVADRPIASHRLHVEEYVPQRMAVTVAAKQPELLRGKPAELAISARYLFGASAMGSGVRADCRLAAGKFAPATNGDLTYGLAIKPGMMRLGEVTGQLDPTGKTELVCPIDPGAAPFLGTAQLTAEVHVLEAGSGRATVERAEAMIHPEAYYLGLRTKAARAASGEPFTVEGMIVDWTGVPLPQAVSQLKLELAHLEWDYSYGHNDQSGEASYDLTRHAVGEGGRDINVANGKFSFDVTPGEASGGYLVRVKAGNAVTELVLDGESPYEYYGYGGQVDQTPRPAKPTQLAIKLPAEIKVGETIEAKLRAPYRGKLLWTVETDRVVRSEWATVAAGDVAWKFKVDAFAPNVYVTAFLVKDPHLESKDAFLPDRAFGISSAKVAPTAFTQSVVITAPKEVRSSSQLAISLDTGVLDGPAFATVAVVDEGILSLTRFATPDPLGELFAKRALGVETYETIGWTMLHQPAGASSRTGGGDDDSAEGESVVVGGRVQVVKSVALFSGIVPVGADGKLKVTFDVPQYRGQLRVMAVVATPSRIGRAEAKVSVRDPLVAQVTFPRFVTQNDEIDVPVFVSNLSGAAMDVSVSLQTEPLKLGGLAAVKPEPPFAVLGKATGTLKLAHGFSDTVVFRVKAQLAVGGARVRVIAKGAGGGKTFESRDDVEVPFHPEGPMQRIVEKIKLIPGVLDLKEVHALSGWVPTSEATTFWMTNNPYGEAFQHLGYLVHYPYGCIEQTVSATRPLLYLGNLVAQAEPELADAKLEDMVTAGILRVLSMETPSGGFGYWPGATEPLEWATAYATDMLLDAKQRGYAIPDDRMTAILAWIEQRATQHERTARATRRGASAPGDAQAEPYLQYVLARAGKGRKARLQHLISQIPATAKRIDLEELYLLKAALYLAGDRRYAKDLKAVDTSPISDERTNDWSFYSDRRRRGMMLSTFFDLFGNDPAGELLATRVAESLTGRASWGYTTQELVWGVTGLGKWVQKIASKATPGGTLNANGAVVAAQPVPPGAPAGGDRTWTLRRASEHTQLTLDVPDKAAGAWLVINSRGVRANGEYKVGGNGLAVTRVYKNRDGEVIDPASGVLKLGEVLFVEVTLTNTSGVAIQNIALVDRIPGGFEIENARLGRGAAASEDSEDSEDSEGDDDGDDNGDSDGDKGSKRHAWQPDFQNVRDDRIEVFGTLPARASKKVIYSVMTTLSGTFAIPPVEAEAMYDPTLWARAKGGTAVIGGPWVGKLL